jgi:hypothetical protein
MLAPNIINRNSTTLAAQYNLMQSIERPLEADGLRRVMAIIAQRASPYLLAGGGSNGRCMALQRRKKERLDLCTCAAIVSSRKDCSRQGSRCWRAAHWMWLGYGCRRMKFAQIRANLGMQADMSGKSTSVDRCIASAPLQGITAHPVASQQVDGFACPRCRRLAGHGCCRRRCSCNSTNV